MAGQDKPKTSFNAITKSLVDRGINLKNLNSYSVEAVDVNDILVLKQIRTEFDSEDSKIEEIGESLKNDGQLQEIGLRPNDTDSHHQYILIYGERRLRGAILKEIPTLRARVFDVDAETAKTIQAVENIQRENLSMLNEATVIKEMIDDGKSSDEVAQTLNKSKSWVSKRLSLLKIGDVSQQLITENLSADIEVITEVARVEKTDPQAAQTIVDAIVANAAPDAPEKKSVRQVVREEREKIQSSAPVEEVQKENEPVKESAKTNPSRYIGDEAVRDLLSQLYVQISEGRANAKDAVKALSKIQQLSIEEYLVGFFNKASSVRDPIRQILIEFREGNFAEDGYLSFCWVAFQFSVIGKKFNLTDVLSTVKP